MVMVMGMVMGMGMGMGMVQYRLGIDRSRVGGEEHGEVVKGNTR
jgi:hypothetical protein